MRENDETITVSISVVVEGSDCDRNILACLHSIVFSHWCSICRSIDSGVIAGDNFNVSTRGLLPGDREVIAATAFLVEGLDIVTETLL